MNLENMERRKIVRDRQLDKMFQLLRNKKQQLTAMKEIYNMFDQELQGVQKQHAAMWKLVN